MAELGGTYETSFEMPGSAAAVLAHFSSLDHVEACTERLQVMTRQDAQTAHFLLEPQNSAGFGMQPSYTVAWRQTDDTVSWTTLEGNLTNEGAARVEVLTEDRVRVHWSQRIAFDLPLSTFLVRTMAPMVSRMIQPSLERYVTALRARFEP
ncbi:MAG: hypothetical protein ACON4N_14790 [Myxococcota bacterium]